MLPVLAQDLYEYIRVSQKGQVSWRYHPGGMGQIYELRDIVKRQRVCSATNRKAKSHLRQPFGWLFHFDSTRFFQCGIYNLIAMHLGQIPMVIAKMIILCYNNLRTV